MRVVGSPLRLLALNLGLGVGLFGLFGCSGELGFWVRWVSAVFLSLISRGGCCLGWRGWCVFLPMQLGHLMSRPSWPRIILPVPRQVMQVSWCKGVFSRYLRVLKKLVPPVASPVTKRPSLAMSVTSMWNLLSMWLATAS